ncbi:DNA polymerase Y family protein, partial [Microbacterium sp. CnD16-F]|nr:DNA polymerase Y family protein [Microbacterium sp. CnD16-F]
MDSALVDTGTEPVRSLVVWVPDWPVVALAREGLADAAQPIAIFAKGTVAATSPAARGDGVRRGMR